jgi:hypothetical protein
MFLWLGAYSLVCDILCAAKNRVRHNASICCKACSPGFKSRSGTLWRTSTDLGCNAKHGAITDPRRVKYETLLVLS